MDYFKINYNKLENLRQINYYKFIIGMLIIIFVLFILGLKINTYHKLQTYGIYSNNSLQIKIESRLSDEMKNSEYIVFNDKKTKFKIFEYGNYEIINNNIYQEITIIMDEKFYNNEIGLVEFYYGKESIFNYILDLFK